MPQKRLEKPDFAPPAETVLETVRTSRRGLFLGMFAVGALGLATTSSPAKAAVSMLRTGLDPDQPETGENALADGESHDGYDTEGQLEDVGYYWGRRRRRRWRRRRRPRVGVRVWI